MNNNFNKTLIVAAHPDDEVLGCGGLIKKLSKMNKKIKVVFLAEGSSCRYTGKELNNTKVKKEIKHREICAKKALKILGVRNIAFYNLQCGKLQNYPIIDLGKIIEVEIKSFKPTAIFTHSNSDVHCDHKTTFQACLQATRPVNKLTKVNYFFSFEILSSSEWKFEKCFEPNFFIDISQEINFKIKAIKKYDSELRKFPHPRSEEGIKTLAKYRGMQANFNFAESFKLIRGFEKSNL